MVKNVLSIIDELNESNSSIHKQNVLTKYKNDESLIKVLYYTYNETFQYFMGLKTFTAIPQGEGIGFDAIFKILDGLRTRKMKSSDINLFATSMTEDEHKLFSLILNRDVKAKIDAKTINKSLGYTLIPVVSYMRCSLPKDANEIIYPAFSQLKSDGMFVNIIVRNGEVSVVSRNGKPIVLEGISKAFNLPQLEGYVFNGELLVLDENKKPLIRQIGNGMLSSVSKRAMTEQTIEEKMISANAKQHQKLMKDLKDKQIEWQETDDNTVINVWDCIPYDYWMTGKTYDVIYSKRFEVLKVLVSNIQGDLARIIESKIVNSYDEAMDHYKEMRTKGEEGTIIKNMNGFWENKTSKNQIKMKEEKEVELQVVGYNPGDPNTEYRDGIGSLICYSSCGKLQVNVSGMKRNERGLEPVDKDDLTKGLKLIEGFDLDYYTGNIITVRFNEVLQSKDGSYSLFLPRIVEVRDDKTVADDLDYILSV